MRARETNTSYFPVRILNVSIMSPRSNPMFIVNTVQHVL